MSHNQFMRLTSNHKCIINPRRTCAARVTVLGVCVCVCVCVCAVVTFSATTLNRTSNKIYQRLQCNTGKVFKMAFCLRSKDRAHYTQVIVWVQLIVSCHFYYFG